jgi:hypothetical protein
MHRPYFLFMNHSASKRNPAISLQSTTITPASSSLSQKNAQQFFLSKLTNLVSSITVPPLKNKSTSVPDCNFLSCLQTQPLHLLELHLLELHLLELHLLELHLLELDLLELDLLELELDLLDM